MTPSERVLRSLQGEKTDKIPFTTYDVFMCNCDDIDSLLRRGLGIVCLACSAKVWMEDVDIKHVEYAEGSHQMIRSTYSTPVGEVYTVKAKEHVNPWIKEHMFKTPEDYRVLQFMFSNQRCCEDYDAILKLKSKLGDNFILRDQIFLEPLQHFITYDVMDMMSFSLEWLENRDEIIKLYEANAKFHEQVYEIVAKGPLDFANYGGNVVPQVIGPDVFRDFYLPHYNMAADALHENGKFLGSHLDADNTIIMDLIGESKLDYIEAYDPSISPSLRVAREKFHDKVLWINWPSGEHHRDISEFEGITKALVEDHGLDSHLLIAITENLPKGKWDGAMHAILDGLSYPK